MKSAFYALCMLLLLTFGSDAQDNRTPEPTATQAPSFSEVNFQLEEVATGFTNPIQVVFANDGSDRLFVVEQAGIIWIVEDGERLEAPFIDLSSVVSQNLGEDYPERGLMSMAFHPDFEENGYFFVNYTDQNNTNSYIVRFSVSTDDPEIADPDSAVEILYISQPWDNHNGGHIAFGPDDGYLYIGVGDGGSSGDPLNTGQNPYDLLGSILRINVDETHEDQPYSSPESNAFATDPNIAPEVWAWGVMNPWRFSFDSATGKFYIGVNGHDQEEIHILNFTDYPIDKQHNMGWPHFDGEDLFRDVGLYDSGATVPAVDYSHGSRCFVIGGYVYRGEAMPELQGVYLYSDFCRGTIWGMISYPQNLTHVTETLLETDFQISSFGVDGDGELYVVDYEGSILKLVPAQ